MSEQRRVINLNGGTYIREVKGDYVEVKGQRVEQGQGENKESPSRNYIENLGGKKVEKYSDEL